MTIEQIIANACYQVGLAEATSRDKMLFEHVLGACALLDEICESVALGMVILAMKVWNEGLPYAAISFGINQLDQDKFEELVRSQGWSYWGKLDGVACGAMPADQYDKLAHAIHYGS